MNSFNHYSLGSIGDWLYGRVAGIDQEPESVGYRRLLLRPTVGGRLTWAHARYDSPRGEVVCGWRRSGDAVELDITVPPGTTARLHVPTEDPDGLVVPDGATVEDRGPSHLTLNLVAGSYQISTPFPRQ
jgi:alpha-L-rhamnosidase